MLYLGYNHTSEKRLEKYEIFLTITAMLTARPTQRKLTRMNSHEIHANSTHEKETNNKHTNIARRKHTIFMRILHDFMRFLYDYHVELILHDFRA